MNREIMSLRANRIGAFNYSIVHFTFLYYILFSKIYIKFVFWFGLV